MSNEEFYQECAISAMQGFQEAGGKLGVLADMLPEEVAKRAFDFADAMLKEYKTRKRRRGLK